MDCVFTDTLRCVNCGRSVASAAVRRTCLVGKRVGPPPKVAAIQRVQPTGPGTHLSRFLRRFGIDAAPGCKCRSMAAKMDNQGCAWCESDQGMAEILEAMRTEAGKRGLPFIDGVGKLLVRQAVRAARRESERAKKAQQAEGREPAV